MSSNNRIKNKTLCILLVFFNIGVLYSQEIDKDTIADIVIKYREYSVGYAPPFCSLCFKKKGDCYEYIPQENSSFSHRQIPQIIKSSMVDSLCHQINNNQNQLCDLLKFNVDEKLYKKYLKGIDDFANTDYRFINPSKKYTKKKLRKLKINSFQLSFKDFEKLSHNPELIVYIPDFEMLLIDKDGNNIIEIYPYSFFKGTPWCISFKNNIYYVDFETVNSFLEQSGLSFCAPFMEQYKLMYEIALFLLSSS